MKSTQEILKKTREILKRGQELGSNQRKEIAAFCEAGHQLMISQEELKVFKDTYLAENSSFKTEATLISSICESEIEPNEKPIFIASIYQQVFKQKFSYLEIKANPNPLVIINDGNYTLKDKSEIKKLKIDLMKKVLNSCSDAQKISFINDLSDSQGVSKTIIRFLHQETVKIQDPFKDSNSLKLTDLDKLKVKLFNKGQKDQILGKISAAVLNIPVKIAKKLGFSKL